MHSDRIYITETGTNRISSSLCRPLYFIIYYYLLPGVSSEKGIPLMLSLFSQEKKTIGIRTKRNINT